MINPFFALPVRFSSWLIRDKLFANDNSFCFADTLSQSFRVCPGDIDFNWHMHNSRYASFMDIGRISFLIKARLVGQMIKRKWFPVLGSSNYYFRRPLNPFEKFTLNTKILCWDDKWFYFVQYFVNSKGDIATIGYVRTALMQEGKGLATDIVLEGFSIEQQSPAMPDDIVNWVATNNLFVDRVKNSQVAQ